MSPPKGSSDRNKPKGGSAAPHDKDWAKWHTSHAFFVSGEDKTSYHRLADVVASAPNQHRSTELPPYTPNPTEGYVRVHSYFLTVGLVPPLSAFMVAVLSEYGILLVHHHHPNNLLALA
jgi:hypothetical protein